jgi:excisionase family DNA binding protein
MVFGVDGDYYTPGQAARILGLTDRHVRHMLAGGELEGEQTESGRWKIPQREAHRTGWRSGAGDRPEIQRSSQTRQEPHRRPRSCG